MGSQTRRSDKDRGHGRRRKTGGGAGGGGGGSEDRVPGKENERELERVYQKASRKLHNALESNDFSYAGSIATSVAATRTPIKETMNLLLAGARAFKQGREEQWKPKPTELAELALLFAQEKTGYELPIEKRQFFSKILAETLSKTAEKSGRKSS